MPQMQQVSQKLLIIQTELESLEQNNIQAFILKNKTLDLRASKGKKYWKDFYSRNSMLILH